MTKINLYNMQGEQKGELEIAESIFGIEPHEDLLHRVVVMQLANKRQGTQKAKTRAEVRGGGRKPYRQKGTGRARQGSIRSPLWVGGGVSFAPVPRSYRTRMNKKMRRLALKSALSSCVMEDKFKALDALELPEIKTKRMVELLKNLQLSNNTLVILPEKDRVVEKSAANIPGLQVEYVNTLNVYDLLKHENVLATEASIRKIEEVYA
ncbi:MAG: 50S ribosomal protein L4 [Eubacteriales bacterium]|nr:50S ribosomal protein L4 [Eubacteriales bacterium]